MPIKTLKVSINIEITPYCFINTGISLLHAGVMHAMINDA